MQSRRPVAMGELVLGNLSFIFLIAGSGFEQALAANFHKSLLDDRALSDKTPTAQNSRATWGHAASAENAQREGNMFKRVIAAATAAVIATTGTAFAQVKMNAVSC